MSKFFFKGRIELPQDYSTYNYNTDPSTKHGTKKHPLSITVTTATRQAENNGWLGCRNRKSHYNGWC